MALRSRCSRPGFLKPPTSAVSPVPPTSLVVRSELVGRSSQILSVESVAVNVIQPARNDSDACFATGRDGQRNSGRSRFQFEYF
jgi:hypothetical protein